MSKLLTFSLYVCISKLTYMSSIRAVLPKDALEGKLLIGLQHVLPAI